MVSLTVTPEIELHPVAESDAEALFDLTDENRAYLRRWLPWLDDTRDVGDTLAFIRLSRRGHAESGALTCAIRFRGGLCGIIGHNRLDVATRTAWIGYWLSEPLQHHGIITGACRALIDHTFRELPVDKVVIHCGIANHASQAVADRLGFHRERILPDAEWLYDHFIDHTVNSLMKPCSVPHSC